MEHPLCAECERQTPPRLTAATVVDHIVPHKGDMERFWDADGWQSLCDSCHGVKTSKEGAFGRNRPGNPA